jgi:hypothetical protein
LHDTYVWEVNAAVGEGRMDLVWQLVDSYMDEALAMMTADDTGCERPDCAICRRASSPAPAPPRRRWLRRSPRRQGR